MGLVIVFKGITVISVTLLVPAGAQATTAFAKGTAHATATTGSPATTAVSIAASEMVARQLGGSTASVTRWADAYVTQDGADQIAIVTTSQPVAGEAHALIIREFVAANPNFRAQDVRCATIYAPGPSVNTTASSVLAGRSKMVNLLRLIPAGITLVSVAPVFKVVVVRPVRRALTLRTVLKCARSLSRRPSATVGR